MIHFFADIGSNFNQDFSRAKELIYQSKESGFYGVKFQAFKADKLYKNPSTELKHILETRQLDTDWIQGLYEYSKEIGIKFGCTPFDMDSLYELVNKVDFIKISSFDILRTDLIDTACKLCNHIIVSLGLATYDDIDNLIEFVFTKYPKNNIEMLHCVSKYPVKIEEVGMDRFAMLLLRYGLSKYLVGYSDHTADEAVIYAICSQLMNKGSIEVHIDLEDGKGYETECGHCWGVEYMKKVIRNVENMETVLHSSFSQDLNLRACAEDGLRR